MSKFKSRQTLFIKLSPLENLRSSFYQKHGLDHDITRDESTLKEIMKEDGKQKNNPNFAIWFKKTTRQV